MRKIKNLGTRIINGNYISYGVFWCDGCKQEVDKPLSSGLRAKSCGKEECRPKYNQGKDHPMYGKHPTEESKKKNSESNKGLKRDFKTRMKMSESHKGKTSPMKGLKQSEETRQKIREGNKGKKRTEEQKKKYSKAFKGRIITEDQKQKIRETMLKNGTSKGENNSNWQGGISDNPYPLEFNKELKILIYERDNYQCQFPNCTEVHKKLHAHHIDYDKTNNDPGNLITLGDSCHMKTVGKKKREYYTEFYQNIMIGKLMECLL